MNKLHDVALVILSWVFKLSNYFILILCYNCTDGSSTTLIPTASYLWGWNGPFTALHWSLSVTTTQIQYTVFMTHLLQCFNTSVLQWGNVAVHKHRY